MQCNKYKSNDINGKVIENSKSFSFIQLTISVAFNLCNPFIMPIQETTHVAIYLVMV